MGTGVIGVHAGRRLWRGARFRMFPGSGPLGVAASTRRGVWTRGLRDGLGQPRPARLHHSRLCQTESQAFREQPV